MSRNNSPLNSSSDRFVQSLEQRRMCWIDAYVAGNVLYVYGDEDDNWIRVVNFGTAYEVQTSDDAGVNWQDYFGYGGVAADSIEIYGRDGDDYLKNLTIDLQATMRGEAGDDSLYAGASGDLLYGGDDCDLLIGDAGSDTLYGDGDSEQWWNNQDILIGWGGNDVLHGGDGPDSVMGGAGDDTLFGDAGDDTIHGNADYDRCLYDQADSDVDCEEKIPNW